MVSLWPWRSEDNSPASFEKILAALAKTIRKSEQQLETLRSDSRRYKALWTLYTSFLYICGLVVLVLVVGWKNWTIWEGTALAGWPLFIYIGRMTLKTYYNYRMNSVNQQLEEQKAVRFKTLEKLKAATKYDTTHELLEKYGSISSSPKTPSSPRAAKPVVRKPSRTSITPPSTANIPRPEQRSPHSTIPQQRNATNPEKLSSHLAVQNLKSERLTTPGSPEFAPNAFSFSSEYVTRSEDLVGGHWYDRFFDLLLGEDETLPRNRVVLICQYCRLVNGQAPPGIKSLESLGNWRCYGCNSMNGDEAKVMRASQRLIDGTENTNVSLTNNTKEKKTDDDLDGVQSMAAVKETAANEKDIESEKSRRRT